MKALRSFLLIAAALFVASPAVAQTTHKVQLTSAGHTVAFGVYVGPYRGMLYAEPGSPMLDLYCVDYFHHISIGQKWTARFTGLDNTSLAGTRWGAIFGTNDARTRYQKAAYLTTLFAINQGSAAWGGIHSAIWYLFSGNSLSANMVTAAQPWLALATQNYQSVDLHQWTVVTDVNTNRYGRYGVQEFITRVNATPEPATLLLLGTGLVAVLGLAVMKKTT